MNDTPLDMLVDHYPIRAVVESYDPSADDEVQSGRLLAEAMAGSEVFLAVTADEADSFKPLTFNINDKKYLIAATSAAYAEKVFISYLVDRVVQGDIELLAIDAAKALRVAMVLDVDAILFDMDMPAGETFEVSLQRSSMNIDNLARKAMTNPKRLLEDGRDEEFMTLPTSILTMLAREPSEAENQEILFDYFSHCSKSELKRLVLFIGNSEIIDADAYTTLPRCSVAGSSRGIRMDKAAAEKSADDYRIVDLWTWLNSIADQSSTSFRLDSILIDASFTNRVISAVDSS